MLADQAAIRSRGLREFPSAVAQEFILKAPMSTFLPIDEQMDLLQKGAAEIIRVNDLRERLEGRRGNHLAGHRWRTPA